MRSRSDDIRKRIEKRKKQRDRPNKQQETKLPWTEDEERYGFDRMASYESGPVEEENHPLFRKEVFIFKVLASACLVLVIAIMFRNQTPELDSARDFVTNSMNEEFQFAAVSDWYESTFGKPLALLPVNEQKSEENGPVDSKQQYALPASGKILENFGENGQRITIETGQGAAVEAMNEGLVRMIGEQEGFGQTVVIQHADKSESWYGNLSEVNVTLYQYIEKGTKVGKATDYGDGTKGSFYFAIKEGEDFVDPIQVIQFD
ncbi:M23 family metallopeptidase [Niallia endozanthoxylica]|uniref:M23 family metallopeptidase n=1 Tax=Niallia endozanthoxylica TaxID=2036016 RepID=A0A5J5HSJ9_9BACI|nr:M23 family metallopeptidase [Niallia endozanthoxylica]KAA9023123.1 M23 family metallopeptidase [Niallia endozanthoxylica]